MTTVVNGDCRDVLRLMDEGDVDCCVTSPPYFGLRDYGVEGQIGLEQTPDEYVAQMVAVFREVRRVLKKEGTLWLNLGDSYAGYHGNKNAGYGDAPSNKGGYFENQRASTVGMSGLKQKDLIGIPWRVAFALQQPYYAGKVTDERDRVWLAAMVDSEGSICGTEYKTGDRTKTNIYVSVTNTSNPIIDKCERLYPQDVKHVYEKSGPSNRVCYRWDVERMETKALFLREIYPYLVAKRKQAIVGYTFLELQRGLVNKKKGYIPEQQEMRSWLMTTLSRLNAGENVDLPDWVVEPPSLFEPGFYLRQDIVWHKPNPMPESVRDRCTKSHEYLFLLSKSERYYFDSEAIAEDCVSTNPQIPWREREYGTGQGVGELNGSGSYKRGTSRQPCGNSPDGKRNKRDVWTITTKPYKGAHFATFPPDLVRPCILAGCPKGGTVLDPFGGSGTTGQVANEEGRNALLIELNPDYIPLINERIKQKGT